MSFLTPGDLPNPEIESASLVSSALAIRFFITSTTWEAIKTWARPSKSLHKLQTHEAHLPWPEGEHLHIGILNYYYLKLFKIVFFQLGWIIEVFGKKKSVIQVEFFIETCAPATHAGRYEPHHASWSASTERCWQ